MGPTMLRAPVSCIRPRYDVRCDATRQFCAPATRLSQLRTVFEVGRQPGRTCAWYHARWKPVNDLLDE